MGAEQIEIALHDRFTRGEHLTDQQLLQLEAWHAQQDGIEQAKLLPKSGATDDLLVLQSQIEALLEQLASVTQQIPKIISENNALRQENNALRQQLTPSRSA
jgi:FtsZ-binding cell division protein ZapB